LYYTSTHEWAEVSGDIVTVGITAYAVEQLSDLVFLELPKVGARATKEDPFGEIESTKTVSELNAPVSGKIVEVNSGLVSNLDAIKDSPYDDGWMVKIKLRDPEELKDLLSALEYAELLKESEE
jgi:glycine cleavage system H protein